MGSIDRYIFRTTLASFALVLVSLTGVIWITQALRGIDLMTSQGQIIVIFIGAYLAPDGLRRIKQWDAEITADVLTNILQPGRFAQLDQNLTIRIRERLPGGVLAGIFVDDRRDPKERVTIVAEHGEVVKNDNGSFLVLKDGNLQRFEAGKRDPALVAFARYGFDMSKFSNQGHDVTLGIRERYLWELFSPSDDDPVYKAVPGQFWSELHDRLMAPLYPFAFAALTFAFLGAPRTTRQSRNFSIGGSVIAVFGLRMAGFACSVMAVKSPFAAAVQYAMLTTAIGAGMWMIVGGVVVEPPAGLMEAINRSNARIAR